MLVFYFSTNGCLNVPVSRTAVSGILLRNRWIVQHGHSFNTQQHSQAPCNHVVEYNGAVGGEEKNKVMRPSSHYMLSFFILRIFSPIYLLYKMQLNKTEWGEKYDRLVKLRL